MARTHYICTGCKIRLPVGQRNFETSNWCKRCGNWKPKTQVKCEHCHMGLRSLARNQVKKVEHIRL